MYSVRGRTAATVATADHALAQLWNPHATQRIYLHKCGLSKLTLGVGQSWRLKKSTVRGTAGSTVTLAISNHGENAIAPPSGLLLDLAAFTTQPTLEASEPGPSQFVSTLESGCSGREIYPPMCIRPGTGVVMVQTEASIWPISEVYFVVSEEPN